MKVSKTIIRILVYFSLTLCIIAACFLYIFGDINKLKSYVEKNLKDQLTCTVKLGELSWDWDGLKLGVTTSEISLYDRENNLVLQAGPSRFIWHIKSIITGTYSHFYGIESANMYLNAIRYKDGNFNIIKIFPPGPPPKADNLKLNNSIIYFVDESDPTSNKVTLYKELNLNLRKKPFSKIQYIDLFSRIGSKTSPSFIKVKGKYTDNKKITWDKGGFDLNIFAKKIDLKKFEGFITSSFKEPEIKKISGEFSGKIHLHKKKHEKHTKVQSVTRTNNFIIELENKGISQLIQIPKTTLVVNSTIGKDKIEIKTFKSTINELSYTLKGFIYNWSKELPELDIEFKTNKFNFKNVKPYIPLSLLPNDARSRIEPINDDGLVEIDLKLSGPSIAPKYSGTILLDSFNLTEESGFLRGIHGLKSKLVLDNEAINIDYLNIPIENSLLLLTGRIDNQATVFKLNGNGLSLNVLKDLLFQAGFKPPIEVESSGKLDLNLDVNAPRNIPPEIKGKIAFHDAVLSTLKEVEPVEIKKIFGDVLLDGSKVIFNKLTGLINNDGFYINGDFSLKEDESVNLSVSAEHLKIIHFILSSISSKTPFKPIAETVTGEASNLNLKIAGTFSKPVLDGMVSVNNVSFSLPNLRDKISSISGNLVFEGSDLVVEELNGMVQNSDFNISGYIQDLFTGPKPNIRLVTGDIEIESFWEYLKNQLKTSSLDVQAQELEKLKGVAALDIFVYPTALSGNVYFKNGEIKYKSLPFGLNNLSGRLVIGEKNLSLFDLSGKINESNNFNCDLTVSDYLSPKFKIQGKVALEADPPALVKAVNPNYPQNIITDGFVPTTINFDISFPWANFSVYSTLDEMLMVDFPPYISKPIDKDYIISANVDLNTDEMALYLNQFNIKSNKLSLTTTGSIKNISSEDPELMLYFKTDEPTAIFMIIEPITPLMGLKIWGMIDLNGSLSGTPSMHSIASDASVTNIRMPELLGKKLTAEDGTFKVYFDTKHGSLVSNLNNINYASIMAKSASLSGKYENPVIYLDELAVNSNPGNIKANGIYNPENGSIVFNTEGSDVELSNLGSFVFLDPEKISGKTAFDVMIKAEGKTKDEIISTSNGALSFSITEGKLGQVALLHKGLKLANLVGQGIFGFNLSNILSLFLKYQDGSFNTIDGALDIKKGTVKANNFHYRAGNLFLNSFGFIDIVNSFIDLSFYGFLPKELTNQDGSKGAISVLPETLSKRRIVIPLLHITPPQYFKFEVKGNLKESKKITRRATRSFRWLRGKRLEKEFKFVPNKQPSP